MRWDFGNRGKRIHIQWTWIVLSKGWVVVGSLKICYTFNLFCSFFLVQNFCAPSLHHFTKDLSILLFFSRNQLLAMSVFENHMYLLFAWFLLLLLLTHYFHFLLVSSVVLCLTFSPFFWPHPLACGHSVPQPGTMKAQNANQ